MKKPLYVRLAYMLRNIQSRKMFDAIGRHCKGDVLDVGGWDFFLTAQRKQFSFDSWTCLEYDETKTIIVDDEAFTLVHGDGCAMVFDENRFDTVLNLQVLEHVMDPMIMVQEIARVLKPGGDAIFLIPQRNVLHGEPNHFYNFTPFWVRKVMDRADLEIIQLDPLGGWWNSAASHHFFFVYHSIRRKLRSPFGDKRHLLYYIFYPAMVLYALVNIPICLLLSIGDPTEEANNLLVVARKPGQRETSESKNTSAAAGY